VQETFDNQNQVAKIEEKLKLENRVKNGAAWFFWIAGLSIVNSIILMVGGQWNFLIGLGITQVIDGIASGVAAEAGADAASIIKLLAFAADIVVAGVFVVFGVLAMRRYKFSFIIGMILYALDGLIFLVVMDFLSIGFHLFALFGLYSGLQAYNKLMEMELSLISPA
jgi:hypothetical protein